MFLSTIISQARTRNPLQGHPDSTRVANYSLLQAVSSWDNIQTMEY